MRKELIISQQHTDIAIFGYLWWNRQWLWAIFYVWNVSWSQQLKSENALVGKCFSAWHWWWLINFSFMWLLFLQTCVSETHEQMSQVFLNKDFVQRKKKALINAETICPGILERYSFSLLLFVESTHFRNGLYAQERGKYVPAMCQVCPS